jgi:quinol-cytochrome oxidoreductase complex cytochrome b subunit/coenzyme F420-reducing hydrogenase delta subunit/NAD-dependent dihydropyrimidine dehydrogenase PreA subunit
LLKTIQKAGQFIFAFPQKWLDRAFGNSLNPLRHLGSLTIFFLWIVLISGIWVTIFFRTSVVGAFESVEYMSIDQWYLGGVMRSLHRYASDAAIVTLVLHVLKEFAFDRYRSGRWFSWFTGVPLLWMIIPLGITGYWLVWDQLALYVALSTSEMLDALPIFTDSMARNFLSNESLSDRFFTLMAFTHIIGLPIFLVFGIWIHVFRINRPKINPPRKVMIGALLTMLVLSFVYPAMSQGKADPAMVPESLALDWYYLLIYPLLNYWPAASVWVLLISFSLLICIAPWLPPARKPAVVRIDLENCNGCERCVEDCPFGAIEMTPRTDGKKYASEAVVTPELCLSCGICVGSCPTATPFRSRSVLSAGIDLPDQTVAHVKDEIIEATKNLQGDRRILMFACKNNSKTAKHIDAETTVVNLTCMAQLPPPFVDWVLSRDYADGVILGGCAHGDCQYRLGAEWTEQRMSRVRDPRLRKRVDTEKLALLWSEPWCNFPNVATAIDAFRATLATSDTVSSTTKTRRHWFRPVGIALAWGVFAFASVAFTIWPRFSQLEPGNAIISLTFSHAGQRVEACRKRTQEELNKLPPNMRKPTDCPRERHPVKVLFSVDDQVLYDQSLTASGFWNDGEATVYHRMELPAGSHDLYIEMSDSGRKDGFDYSGETTFNLATGQHMVVEFDHLKQTFIFR